MTELYEQDPLLVEESIEEWVMTKCEDWRDYYESNYEGRFEEVTICCSLLRSLVACPQSEFDSYFPAQ